MERDLSLICWESGPGTVEFYARGFFRGNGRNGGACVLTSKFMISKLGKIEVISAYFDILSLFFFKLKVK